VALTLIEAAIEYGIKGLQAGVIKMFAESTPIWELMPMQKIDGDTYTYAREVALPGIGWRGLNTSWPESTGVINPLVERLQILGGEVKIDDYLLETRPNGAPDLKATQFRMKSQAASNEFSRSFLEGDDLADPNQMVGLRRRLTGSQVITAGVNGATLSLDMLDELLDLVPFENKVLFMNRYLRRVITKLITSAAGARQIQMGLNAFGEQVETYGGARLAIVELSGSGTTYLDFDETTGSSNVTSSIYCVSFGDDRVHGIYNNGDRGKLVSVKDFGELEAEPRHMGRLSMNVGMVVEHPRSASRLRGITQTMPA
jgi:hypothetical protein